MAGRTNSERIADLERTGAPFTERVDRMLRLAEAAMAAHAESAREIAALRQEVALLKLAVEKDLAAGKAERAAELALLRREVDELKSWKADEKKRGEEWGRRVWAFGPNLLAAVIGGLLGAALTYLLPRR